MEKRKLWKKGFTLIELMTVVIIVGILAAVAVPLYRTNVRKAKATEGAALLGAVRTAERVYYAEHNEYTSDKSVLGVDTEGNKYFTDYTINSADADGFEAQTDYVEGGKEIHLKIDEEGELQISYDGENWQPY